MERPAGDGDGGPGTAGKGRICPGLPGDDAVRGVAVGAGKAFGCFNLLSVKYLDQPAPGSLENPVWATAPPRWQHALKRDVHDRARGRDATLRHPPGTEA